MKRKRAITIVESLLLALLFLTNPILDVFSFEAPVPEWTYWMKTDFTHPVDMFATWNPTNESLIRKAIFLADANDSEGWREQAARLYLGYNVTDDQGIINHLERIYNYEDCLDFDLASLVRFIYLDINQTKLGNPLLNTSLKHQISDAFGKCKYWYDEPHTTNCIYSTENHQILYHSAELLVGQLYPTSTFMYSNRKGYYHYTHAKERIIQWLDWRARLGFSEWHSNVYYNEDIAALVNLVDFANDTEIVTKSAMVLDLIAFDFATNYFNSTQATYAVPQGREYDGHKEGKSATDRASRDSIAEAAWLMLGIGAHVENSTGSMAAIALATSDHYATPPILEEIAKNASKSIEQWERNGINMEDGHEYGITYDEEDITYWWGMSALLAPQTIVETLRIFNKHNIRGELEGGIDLLTTALSILGFLRGMSLGQYSNALNIITQGVCLEAANIYTYRTQDYQLSVAQDHRKGRNSMQSHVWQATLDVNATVFTCSPGEITQGFEQRWVGGWLPRATAYKNVNIIQYDRTTLPLEAEFLLLILRLIFGPDTHYIHAHFPRWAFDEWVQYGDWTFGKKGDGYVALYSYKPTWWHNNHDLRVQGSKNAWICELGSANEYNTFENFTTLVRQAPMWISPQALGYNIRYTSPSQGLMSVSWDDPLQVSGSNVDLGPYKRFDNPYCTQNFNTTTTIITLPGTSQRLGLYFHNATRRYLS